MAQIIDMQTYRNPPAALPSPSQRHDIDTLIDHLKYLNNGNHISAVMVSIVLHDETQTNGYVIDRNLDESHVDKALKKLISMIKKR